MIDASNVEDRAANGTRTARAHWPRTQSKRSTSGFPGTRIRLEWKTAFSLAGETRRGHIEFARFCDEWLDATEDYAVTIRQVTDLEDDRVFIVSDLAFKGRGTGIEVNGVSFAVVTVREGLVARIDEYSNREEALEAVGLSG